MAAEHKGTLDSGRKLVLVNFHDTTPVNKVWVRTNNLKG